jgi:hypothetical protein
LLYENENQLEIYCEPENWSAQAATRNRKMIKISKATSAGSRAPISKRENLLRLSILFKDWSALRQAHNEFIPKAFQLDDNAVLMAQKIH